MEIHIRDTCPECQGAKWTKNSQWNEVVEALEAEGKEATEENIKNWFLTEYQMLTPPPKEIICETCHGAGTKEDWVSFEEFTKELLKLLNKDRL